MTLSVIIPTCNRNNLLSKCLDWLGPIVQNISFSEYEVIVTDDSKDNIARSLIEENYPWAKWMAGPKNGPAANRNSGAKCAKGEWLIFIDDDCLPDKDILLNYKLAISQYSGTMAFEGAIFPDDWNLLKTDMSECPVNTAGGCFWSANICINKKIFEKINGFDEGFLIAAQEDQDIFERLKKITNIVFLENCLVVHPVRFVSLRKKLSSVKVSIENWYFFAKKNKSFSSCVLYGVKTHVKALINNAKNRRFKSIAYHTYNLFVFLPILIRLKLQNE